jgi:hypothetical protein
VEFIEPAVRADVFRIEARAKELRIQKKEAQEAINCPPPPFNARLTKPREESSVALLHAASFMRKANG